MVEDTMKSSTKAIQKLEALLRKWVDLAEEAQREAALLRQALALVETTQKDKEKEQTE